VRSRTGSAKITPRQYTSRSHFVGQEPHNYHLSSAYLNLPPLLETLTRRLLLPSFDFPHLLASQHCSSPFNFPPSSPPFKSQLSSSPCKPTFPLSFKPSEFSSSSSRDSSHSSKVMAMEPPPKYSGLPVDEEDSTTSLSDTDSITPLSDTSTMRVSVQENIVTYIAYLGPAVLAFIALLIKGPDVLCSDFRLTICVTMILFFCIGNALNRSIDYIELGRHDPVKRKDEYDLYARRKAIVVYLVSLVVSCGVAAALTPQSC
jgi:hypothetical protein